eukprot:scaffold204407_cov18-Tisochrysis_lutea.AAC.2
MLGQADMDSTHGPWECSPSLQWQMVRLLDNTYLPESSSVPRLWSVHPKASKDEDSESQKAKALLDSWSAHPKASKDADGESQKAR